MEYIKNTVWLCLFVSLVAGYFLSIFVIVEIGCMILGVSYMTVGAAITRIILFVMTFYPFVGLMVTFFQNWMKS